MGLAHDAGDAAAQNEIVVGFRIQSCDGFGGAHMVGQGITQLLLEGAVAFDIALVDGGFEAVDLGIIF